MCELVLLQVNVLGVPVLLPAPLPLKGGFFIPVCFMLNDVTGCIAYVALAEIVIVGVHLYRLLSVLLPLQRKHLFNDGRRSPSLAF